MFILMLSVVKGRIGRSVFVSPEWRETCGTGTLTFAPGGGAHETGALNSASGGQACETGTLPSLAGAGITKLGTASHKIEIGAYMIQGRHAPPQVTL